MSGHPARGRLVVLAVLGLVIVLYVPAGLTPASADDAQLRLTAGSTELGWVSLALRGPVGRPVEVREQIGDRRRFVARITGSGERRRAARWRCGRRLRRFVATSFDPGGAAWTSSATVRTPSCANRLQMIVAPAQLRPGQSASVRLADSWRFGGLSAKLCARTRRASAGCRVLRLAPGRIRQRSRVRLTRSGRWRIALRYRSAPPLKQFVTARPGARLRVLVTGDSMIYHLDDVLARRLDDAALVRGDPRPGTAISKPSLLDWPAHAETSALAVNPDVTLVFLGVSDYHPLTTLSGPSVQCCASDWIEEYARRVSAMTASYLRDGRALVYWTLLPAPRSTDRVRSVRAVNRAIRRAAASFPDGVRLIDLATVISPHGDFQESIIHRGRLRRVREDDGLHLSRTGTRITASIIVRALRSDAMVR